MKFGGKRLDNERFCEKMIRVISTL